MVAMVYLAVALLAFLPALMSPGDWTGTEARRVQIALEMLQRGEWLVPTLGSEPTLSKPPLHYWVLGMVARVAGTEPWQMRMPGALAFFGLALLAHALVRRSHDERAAWCAGVGVLLSPLAIALVPRAEIDPLFAGLAAGSILLLARGAAYGSTPLLVAGGMLAGLTLLAKGPPFLLLLVGTVAVWIRRRRGKGLALALLLMSIPPLVYYLALAGVVGLDNLLDVARSESVGRVRLFTWTHVLDTPMHLLRSVAVSLPFGLFLFFEYRFFESKGARRAEPDAAETFVRMAAAAAFSTVLILVVFPARPMRYLLPAVPLFFVAVSPSVAAFARAVDVPPLARRVVQALALIGAAGLCATPWLPPPFGIRTSLGLLVAASLPWYVIDGRRTVIAMLLLPVMTAWTFVAPFAEHRARWRDPFALGGDVLRRTLAARQADDLATLLHVPSPLLLHAGVLPAGDEFAQREPTARWLLMEEGARPQEAWLHLAKARLPPKEYVPRVRLQMPRFTLVLLERR